MARYFAANKICTPTNNIICGVVVIEHGIVLNAFKLEKELSATIWLGGTVYVRHTPVGLQAYKNGILIED